MISFDHTAMLRELGAVGWAKFEFGGAKESELLAQAKLIADKLGNVVHGPRGQLIDALVPSEAGDVWVPSLSRKYGLNEFPLHCDTAQWMVPARYILLVCINPGERGESTFMLDTVAMNLTDEERELALSSIYSVKNGRRSFYSTILSSRRSFVRLDQGCMQALDLEGERAFEIFRRSRWQHKLCRVSWKAGNVLVMDNWRVLHGREEVADASCNRRLMRLVVR